MSAGIRLGSASAWTRYNFPLMLVKVLHAARCACMLGQDGDTLLGVFHVEHASKSDGSGRMPTMHGNGDRR
jgi:hypothetical protein